MTLDEMEVLAREVEADYTQVDWLGACRELARALLALLPVARAAEIWCFVPDLQSPDGRAAIRALAVAVEKMRAEVSR